ncbi:MAG TPA: hypothetical protein PLP42_16475 [Acidobacteriota bacterium]|nr:hypothetical protein [Acidobacteriota bacterium]
MRTPWIGEKQLARAIARNEEFWGGQLNRGPLLWVSVPNAKPGPKIPEPEREEDLWTDPEYAIAAADNRLSRTLFLADALPVYIPWLGPDQFAGWLGADLDLRPRELNTSWATPFLTDWEPKPEFEICEDNRWWRLFLDLTRRSAECGRDKWITAYPDLHAGIDALRAIRGAERLSLDLIDHPEAVKRAMKRMTQLWKEVVDEVARVIEPYGQGSSNWTMGWSAKRFLCIGHNDFTCMISPAMFEEFCGDDLSECCEHVDYSIYHLDGPGAIRHLPRILEESNLQCIQWIPGAGAAPVSHWIPLLQQIQQAGKTVQLWPLLNCRETELLDELRALEVLDRNRLFIVVEPSSVELAEAVVRLFE